MLAANGLYWQKPPALSRVHLLVVRSEATRVSMLETGDADYGEFSRTALPQIMLYAPGAFMAFKDGLKGITEREGLFALHNIPSFYAISSSVPRE